MPFKANIIKLTPSSPGFPRSLINIPSPPKQVYASGDTAHLNNKKCLTVVGSRKVSPYGRAVTETLVREVCKYNVIIASGLALGADSIAHKSAIDNGGITVAVMPAGLDKIYPSSHSQLAKRIIATGGALISEYPEGTPPLKQHFIARNRLVAGLGDAVLITEAALKSGTLSTANFALDQGKTVMAVPGNITSPLSQGTNQLIQSGAVPITKAEDILFALGINFSQADKNIYGDTAEETTIINLLRNGPNEVSVIQAMSKLDASVFNQTLTMLEIKGKIRSIGGSKWTLS